MDRHVFLPTSHRLRKWGTFGLVTVVLLVATVFGLSAVANARTFQFYGDLTNRVDTSTKVVALTFDDGPDPDYTPSVLETLARFEAKATFFTVGVNAAAYPGLLARELAAGHRIGNHTLDHADLELVTPEEVAAEIDKGEQAIVGAGAPRPDLFRPPMGFTDEVVGVFADAYRYRTIFWGVCVERFVDHAGVRPGIDRLLARVRPGTIVLAHDGGHIEAPDRPVVNRDRTMEALPLLLDGIRRKGLQAVDVATLLAVGRRSRRSA